MTIRTISSSHAAIRAELLSSLRARVQSWNVPQHVAAARLGISRPCLNMLLMDKRTFSLDALIRFADAAELEIEVRIGVPNGRSLHAVPGDRQRSSAGA